MYKANFLRRLLGYVLMISLIYNITGCSTTKNIPERDALYTGANIKIEDSTKTKKQRHAVLELVETLPRPKPNSKILGIPLKLMIYNLGGDPKKKSKIGKFIRKLGQEPVLLSRVNLEYNNKVMSNYLQNVGYFKAEVTGDTTIKKKKAHATYTVKPGPLYTIDTVRFVTDSTALMRSIKATEPKTLLKAKDPFNLDVIKAERVRIDAILKEQGYYYFSPDLLILDVDSTIGNNKVNMYVKLKENVPLMARKPYIIDNVYIFANYRINANIDTLKSRAKLYNGYYIVDRNKRFKPQLFPRILRFDSGDVYNRKDHNLTLNRLINLDVYKFVKNRFELAPETSQYDTGRLNAFYYLTPQPKKSLRAEFNVNSKAGNNSANSYLGNLITLSWRNRNAFKGAEQVEVHANTGSEVQYSKDNTGFNIYRLGAGITFTVPKFVVPFFKFNTTSAYVPRSKIEFNYDLLNRQKLYTLQSFKAELGYIWKPEIKKEHQFNPFSINYVQPLNITQLYLDSLAKEPSLRQPVDTQFIIGSNYTFTYDPLAVDAKAEGLYFSGNLDLSGNIAGLATGADIKNGNPKRIAGSLFSQYIKTSFETRYYLDLNKQTRWVNRAIFGFGYPYGNSTRMPFIKQFFIGGNNSIRAFRTRSLGPGTYVPKDVSKNAFLADQSGDIKIELNTELRYSISPIIEVAGFVDAGNIWLYNDDPNKPGGQFNKDFLKQFAIGAGAGLRFNLQVLLLRLDAAVPIRRPWDYLPQAQQPATKQTNVVFNLAIGYPF